LFGRNTDLGEFQMKPALTVALLGLLAVGVFLVAAMDPEPAEAMAIKSPGVYIDEP